MGEDRRSQAAMVGALDTVGEAVVGGGVGLRDTVGAVVPPGMMDTSAQLKNTSGHVVPLVPSSG
eukprot:CAMPEP_0196175220 /NCGR_PEP_ID=MMETSP0911-20130528/7922_1 /TAXON_ID=49265 /ORGANISM="Thalassiosira rotula, Strain GSO102" /LENGTH=63 /DNA_ID=CAMNT_0041442727 /DNA_START=152 /DNA_END=342 /DNA_ORIENTATION=+